MGILDKLFSWGSKKVSKCKHCGRWIRNEKLREHQGKCKKEQKAARKRTKREKRKRRRR